MQPPERFIINNSNVDIFSEDSSSLDDSYTAEQYMKNT